MEEVLGSKRFCYFFEFNRRNGLHCCGYFRHTMADVRNILRRINRFQSTGVFINERVTRPTAVLAVVPEKVAM